MSLGQVDKTVSDTAPKKDAESVWFFVAKELAQVIKQARAKWNAFALLVDAGTLEIGGIQIVVSNGVPATVGPEGSMLINTDPLRAFFFYSSSGGAWVPVV